MASQAVTTLVTEAGTKGWSAFWAISSFPSASITSTSPDGASAATFSLAPARAGAGSKSRAQASRRDHMALQRGIGDAGTIARAKGRSAVRRTKTRGAEDRGTNVGSKLSMQDSRFEEDHQQPSLSRAH